APERLAALDVGVGLGGLLEPERPVDHGPQPPRADVVDQPGDHRVRPRSRRELCAEEVAHEALVALAHGRHVERLLRSPAGVADADHPAAVAERLEAALQRLATDGVDDQVDAAPVGEPTRLGDEVVRAVVDAVVEAQLDQALQPLVARRRRQDAAPARAALWVAATPHPPAPAWT